MRTILAYAVSALICLGALAGNSPESAAAVVTFNFAGSVSSVPDDDSGQLAVLNIVSGTTFSGQFSYDTATAASSGTATSVLYTGLGANLVLSQGTTLSKSPNTVRVSNDDIGFADSLIATNSSATSNDLTGSFTMNIILQDSTDSMFSSTALPTSLNLANHNFGPNLAVFRGGSGDRDRFFGTFTSLSVVDTPEPGTLALFSVGLIGLSSAWRRKVRSR